MNVLQEQEFRFGAVLPDGRLLISNHATDQVLVAEKSGVVICAVIDSHFNKPEGLAVDPKAKEIYVADRYNHCIKVFDFEFVLKRTMGGKGILNQPAGIAFDLASFHLYVADSQNHRIAVFNPHGVLVHTIGSGFGKKENQLCGPSAVALYNGLVIVSEYGNGRLQVFKNAKSILVVDGFPMAQHVVCDPNTGKIYVSLHIHKRIRKIQIHAPDPETHPRFSISEEAISMDYMPNGLFLVDGTKLAVVTKTSIKKINLFWN